MANKIRHQNYLKTQETKKVKNKTNTITNQQIPDLGQAHTMRWG